MMKKGRIKRKTTLLSLSPWILATACLILLLVIAFFALGNFKREKGLVTSAIEQKGLTLVRFINSTVAGTVRASFQDSGGYAKWEDYVQPALELAVEQPGVDGIEVVDRDGILLLSAGKKRMIDDAAADVIKKLQGSISREPGERWQTVILPKTKERESQAIFVAQYRSQRMNPEGVPERRGQMMGRRFRHHPQFKSVTDDMARIRSLAPVYVVWLDMEQFSAPLKKQFVQIVLELAAIVLVAIGGTLSFVTLTKVKRLEKELQRSERLAAIGKMAAGVAHELRNPLSSIKGLATLLKSKSKAGGEGFETADTLVREVERLNRSIGELLDYAKPGTPEREPCQLETIVDKTLLLLEPDLNELDIAVKKNYDKELRAVMVDPDKIRQVLLNILLNAIQAMENIEGERRLEIGLKGDDGQVLVSIRDNGSGIAPEAMKKIFDPYFTTKNSGTGLGLALSLKTIEEHGGSLRADNNPTEGTTFQFTLPAS